MAEQTQTAEKTKKTGLLRRVFWWLWVVLLAALLVLGLVFAATWKVLALFLIFLAAATILPQIYRKWFWLGVGILIIALIVWVFLPEDNKDWRPYTFDKELAQLQAKYAVPDSENAAIIYNQLLENWKQKKANEPNLPDNWHALAMKGPWLSKDQPEITAYLWYHRDTIDRVLQATKLQKCSFLVVSNVSDFSKDFPRLSATRQWTYLLIAACNNDLAEGNLSEAIEKFTAVLRMGQHLSQQLNATSVLCGIAIESVGLGGINRFVIEWDANESYLNEIEQTVSKIKHDWSFDLSGFFDTDKLMFKNMCGLMWYQVNAKGKIRLNRAPSAVIREQTKEQFAGVTVDDADIFTGYWFKKLFKAYTMLYWFYVPATPDKLSKIIDASYKENYQMASPDFNRSKKPDKVPPGTLFKLNLRYFAKIMASMSKDVYFRINDIYLKSSAKQKGTLLILEMRRYKNANGHWPEKLEDIENSAPAEIFIDPLNGDSFVYKRTEDNFTLYSKGKNGIDEGGEFQSRWPLSLEQLLEAPSPDDRMIWPYKGSGCN